MPKIIPFRTTPTPKDRFIKVVEPHFDALYKAARRMALSQADAEDLVQDVCLKALASIDDLEQVEYPRAWLLKVMYNRFIDGTRQTVRSPLDSAVTGVESMDPDELAGSADPERQVDREQQVQRVLRAMRCLNREHCAMVAMHDVEGMSIEELCAISGLPEGTIKARLSRTREKIGRIVSREDSAPPRLKLVGSE